MGWPCGAGPYLIAAGLDESVPDAAPVMLRGRFISLFDPTLAVVTEVALDPGPPCDAAGRGRRDGRGTGRRHRRRLRRAERSR